MSNRRDNLCLCFDGRSINLTTDPELKWQSAKRPLNTSQFKTVILSFTCQTLVLNYFKPPLPMSRCIILILIIMDECIHPWWYKQPQEAQGHISKNMNSCNQCYKHFNICIVTLPLQICDMNSHSCIFFWCIPPWRWLKNVRGLPHLCILLNPITVPLLEY